MPVQVPPPSRHGLASSHFRSRTHLPVFRLSVITQEVAYHRRCELFHRPKIGTSPPKKKAKVSEPIDLTKSSSEPKSEPTPSPLPAKKSPPPTKKPQPSQTPQENLKFP
ncbi:hypothetical protein CK203_042017 [Vitis vinifera]|uniref:Uncharacterized protein n=1 Tax=Vitis vinifera TaxID=29760 RepID=A0A438I0H7_VITVI|nr:hypothetical protein CK203_042017 [Vitis vinifera]